MFQNLKIAAVSVALVVSAQPGQAASEVELDTLFDALGTGELIEILRLEGLEQSDEMRESMFPQRANGWDRIVSSIYDTDRMEAEFREAFDAELIDSDVMPLLEFFGSELGEQIISLEIAARKALLDEDVEEAAKDAFLSLPDRDEVRADALAAFVETNDLIELNVAGALNASLSFYRGLADGGSFDLTEEVILQDVWAQEPDIRQETTEWILPYLALAYEPLSENDLAAYQALSVSEAGKDLNRALFAGFDVVFNRISYSLGSAASRFMQGDDI